MATSQLSSVHSVYPHDCELPLLYISIQHIYDPVAVAGIWIYRILQTTYNVFRPICGKLHAFKRTHVNFSVKSREGGGATKRCYTVYQNSNISEISSRHPLSVLTWFGQQSLKDRQLLIWPISPRAQYIEDNSPRLPYIYFISLISWFLFVHL